MNVTVTEKKFASYVDNDGIEKIQALEKEIGTRLMAYSTPPVPEDILAENLKKIEALENELCVRLVAYKTH
jgi:hypothetical protein